MEIIQIIYVGVSCLAGGILIGLNINKGDNNE